MKSYVWGICWGALLGLSAVTLRGEPPTSGPPSPPASPASSDAPDSAPGKTGLSVDWVLDRLALSNGRTLEGLIEQEDDRSVTLLQVQRPAGKRMYFVRSHVPKETIVSEQRLSDAERTDLAERIKQYRNRGELEIDAMRELLVTREKKDRSSAWAYDGVWFHALSTADEETTRRSIVRMERVFNAYRSLVPPRVKPKEPLNIYLARSSAEYYAVLQAQGVRLSNPAFFVPSANVVFTGLDISWMKTELERVTARHQQLVKQIKEAEDKLKKDLYRVSTEAKRKGVPTKMLIEMNQQVHLQFDRQTQPIKRQLADFKRRGFNSLDDMTKQTYAILYHEAFHAYLENYVYPHDEYDVPHWLNEGLAQIFETGVMEVDALRVDAPSAEMLADLQADLRGIGPLRLETLLLADGEAFMVDSNDEEDLRTSQRSYLYSWGLAYYLAMDRQVLGSEALDRYVAMSDERRKLIAEAREAKGDSADKSKEQPPAKASEPPQPPTTVAQSPPENPPAVGPKLKRHRPPENPQASGRSPRVERVEMGEEANRPPPPEPPLPDIVQTSQERRERFEALVGMPISQFEKQWRAYILGLKAGAKPVSSVVKGS